MTTLEPLHRPEWLSEQSWPWPAGSLMTPVGRIAVTDAGSGPVLLLVHTGTWSFVWRDLMRELTSHFRCVALDAPGCGRSERPTSGRATLAAAAAAIGSVIDQLDLREFTLAAHDLGGPSGLEAVAERPERVRGIVAINTFGWGPAGILRGALRIVGSAPVRELDVLTGFLPAIGGSSLGAGRHLSHDDRAAYRAGIGVRERRAFHRYTADASSEDRLYGRVDAALRGPLADQPVLTVFGERNDPFHFQARWKALFPHARQYVVPRGNHYPMCDDPTGVANAIRDWHADSVARKRTPSARTK